jgi:hypothetical protein
MAFPRILFPNRTVLDEDWVYRRVGSPLFFIFFDPGEGRVFFLLLSGDAGIAAFSAFHGLAELVLDPDH